MFKIVGLINYLFVVFLNAFTDLGHKIIIQNSIFKIYDGGEQIVLTAIVNALILLPFLLVFSPAGFLSDKFAKNIIMKYSSLIAVVITLVITLAYYQGWFYLAFFMTFILALQSAFYAPAKYGYIKELVGIKYISQGNAAVQATTTVAILSGILVYTVLFENMLIESYNTTDDILRIIAPLGWLLVLGSVVELFLASRLPNKMQKQLTKRFVFKEYLNGRYLRKNLFLVKRDSEVFHSIISLALFWSISQVVLAVFPEYAKNQLGITNTIIVQGMMALSVIGIVIGSIIAANFSKYYINTGLSTIGALGIAIVLFLIPNTNSSELLFMLFAIFGFFSGFILVPLNSKIQFLSPNVHLGVILAGNNFIQTTFMFIFLIITTIFAYYGFRAVMLLYIIAFVGVYLAIKLFKKYFVMMFWTIIELFFKSRHSYNYVGLENIPKDGAILLLGNHVSWIDWFIVQLPIERRISFLLEKDIYKWRFFNTFFRLAKIIPVSNKGSKDAFKEASKRLKNSHIVGLFPEGSIARTNKLGKFYRGYELIDKDYDGIIIPYFIDGVFGSIFSRFKQSRKKSIFAKREITLYFGKPLPKDIKADDLKEVIQGLKR